DDPVAVDGRLHRRSTCVKGLPTLGNLEGVSKLQTDLRQAIEGRVTMKRRTRDALLRFHKIDDPVRKIVIENAARVPRHQARIRVPTSLREIFENFRHGPALASVNPQRWPA